MRRWSLPLLLAVLLTAPGCVTVDPAPLSPPPGIRAPAAADHKHPADPLPARPGPGRHCRSVPSVEVTRAWRGVAAVMIFFLVRPGGQPTR
ncbi:hypothetical protein ACFVYT_41630, partial [Streptomyces sp. NPDC058290]